MTAGTGGGSGVRRDVLFWIFFVLIYDGGNLAQIIITKE